MCSVILSFNPVFRLFPLPTQIPGQGAMEGNVRVSILFSGFSPFQPPHLPQRLRGPTRRLFARGSFWRLKNGLTFRSFSHHYRLHPLLRLSENLRSRGTQLRLSQFLPPALFRVHQHTSSIAQHVAKREGFVLAIGRGFQISVASSANPLSRASGICLQLLA